jgi:hypothetical protein
MHALTFDAYSADNVGNNRFSRFVLVTVSRVPSAGDKPLTNRDLLDPRGLIGEAFNIENISEADCRSIFFDWALGLPADVDLSAATRALRTRYVDHGTEHPMNKVLSEGESTPVRKRGERRRRKDNS